MMHLIDYKTFRKTTAFFMLQPCRAMYGFILTIVITCVIAIVWAIFAPMNDVIKTSVILRTEGAISSVRCVAGGELVEKQFDNGQTVSEGDLLFSFDVSVAKAELASEKLQLTKIIDDIQIAEILLNSIRTGDFPACSKESDAYIRSASYVYKKEQYEMIIQDVKTKLEREQEKPVALSVPQTIQDLQNQYEQNILEYNTWQTTQLTQTVENYKELKCSKDIINNQISELEKTIKNSTLYAPISGRIAEVKKANVGDYIMSGEEILKIVPENENSLLADLYVDPAYIARVSVGDSVKIKFTGLPPSRYGQVETEVYLIPPDCTLLSNGSPVFVVKAKIKEPFLLSSKGVKANLLPGITAEGRIITEKSTVLYMLLRKLDFLN